MIGASLYRIGGDRLAAMKLGRPVRWIEDRDRGVDITALPLTPALVFAAIPDKVTP